MSDKETTKEEKKTINIKGTAGKIAGVVKSGGEKAGKMAGAVRSRSEKAGVAINNAKNDYERKRYVPITLEDFKRKDFLPDIVYIVEEDKRLSSENYNDAIGYIEAVKSDRKYTKVLKLLEERISSLKYSFIPGIQSTVYYKHPYEVGKYIGIDDYFEFIKKKKVDELDNVARKLGAKKVKITLKEEKKSFAKKNITGKAGGNKPADNKKDDDSGEGLNINSNIDHCIENKQLTTLSVLCQSQYEGSDKPVEPKLEIYKDDENIINLIDTRINDINSIKKKVYSIKYNSMNAMSSVDAMGLDSVIKKYKLNGNISCTSEVETENRFVLEYEIEF